MGSHSLTTSVKGRLKETFQPEHPGAPLAATLAAAQIVTAGTKVPSQAAPVSQEVPTGLPHTSHSPRFPTAESLMSCSINQFIPGALTQNCPSWCPTEQSLGFHPLTAQARENLRLSAPAISLTWLSHRCPLLSKGAAFSPPRAPLHPKPPALNVIFTRRNVFVIFKIP